MLPCSWRREETRAQIVWKHHLLQQIICKHVCNFQSSDTLLHIHHSHTHKEPKPNYSINTFNTVCIQLNYLSFQMNEKWEKFRLKMKNRHFHINRTFYSHFLLFSLPSIKVLDEMLFHGVPITCWMSLFIKLFLFIWCSNLLSATCLNVWTNLQDACLKKLLLGGSYSVII